MTSTISEDLDRNPNPLTGSGSESESDDRIPVNARSDLICRVQNCVSAGASSRITACHFDSAHRSKQYLIFRMHYLRILLGRRVFTDLSAFSLFASSETHSERAADRRFAPISGCNNLKAFIELRMSSARLEHQFHSSSLLLEIRLCSSGARVLRKPTASFFVSE
jgi:hypothetical protein